MSSRRENLAEARLLKLEDVKRQIDDGSLVVREMTEEERLQYPPRPAGTRRAAPKYGGVWNR